MLIGHNPGLGRLAVSLCGDGPRKPLERMRGKFPTAALAVIEFDVDRWDQLAAGTGPTARVRAPEGSPMTSISRASTAVKRPPQAMMNVLAILGLGYAGVVVLLYLLQTSSCFPGRTCRVSA